MSKYTYIKKQMAKTNKKNDENYVITRIWHQLNNPDIKIVTQQYVVRENGTYALTDLYFPQLQLHVEVDERHHDFQKDEDKIREEDIVGITNHEVRRIKITDNLEEIHAQIDALVDYIQTKVKQLGADFIPWDIEKEQDPQTYIDKGEIHLKDKVSFKTIKDVCNMFGHQYTGYQQGGAKHPYREDILIWFPKLFPNNDWNNTISPDEQVIREKNIHEDKTLALMERIMHKSHHKRIVFPKVKGPLGNIEYTFKGEYQLDMEASKQEQCLVWRRITTEVKTYPPKVKSN